MLYIVDLLEEIKLEIFFRTKLNVHQLKEQLIDFEKKTKK